MSTQNLVCTLPHPDDGNDYDQDQADEGRTLVLSVLRDIKMPRKIMLLSQSSTLRLVHYHILHSCPSQFLSFPTLLSPHSGFFYNAWINSTCITLHIPCSYNQWHEKCCTCTDPVPIGRRGWCWSSIEEQGVERCFCITSSDVRPRRFPMCRFFPTTIQARARGRQEGESIYTHRHLYVFVSYLDCVDADLPYLDPWWSLNVLSSERPHICLGGRSTP